MIWGRRRSVLAGIFKRKKAFVVMFLVCIAISWNAMTAPGTFDNSNYKPDKKLTTLLAKDPNQRIAAKQTNSSLLVITAFSQNHMLESVKLMKNLISNKYTGPLAIYLLKQPHETFSKVIAHTFPKLLQQSPLNVVSIQHMNATDHFRTYCFKSYVIQDALQRHDPDIIMWADTSVEFQKDPQLIADEMVTDGTQFLVPRGVLGMGQNTYNETAAWFGLDRLTFKERYELWAGGWFATVKDQNAKGTPTPVFQEIIQPYMDCAINHCRECMAPGENLKSIGIGIERLKKRGETVDRKGPPSTQFLAHRQDQSVLSLLAYKYLSSHPESQVVKILKPKNDYVIAVRAGDGATKTILDILQR